MADAVVAAVVVAEEARSKSKKSEIKSKKGCDASVGLVQFFCLLANKKARSCLRAFKSIDIDSDQATV